MNKNDLRKRIIWLREEHRDLDHAISNLIQTGVFDQLRLQRLKKRKLALKDLIGQCEAELHPDIIA